MAIQLGNTFLHGNGFAFMLVIAFTVAIALLGTTLAAMNTGVRISFAMAQDEAMDHPETVDLSVLAQPAAPPANAWWRSSALRAVGLGILLLGALGVLAVLLQSLRP